MVAWMRHRGHSWRLGTEMAVAMIVPAVALVCLYWLHGIGKRPALRRVSCGMYIRHDQFMIIAVPNMAETAHDIASIMHSDI